MGRTHGFGEDQIRRIWENLQFGGRLEYGDKRKKKRMRHIMIMT